jgi:serine protease Do
MPRFASRLSPVLFCSYFLLLTHAEPRADEAPPKPLLTADAVQEAFVRVAEKIKPSVVTIYAERAPKSTPAFNKTGKDKENAAPDENDDDDGGDLPSPFGPRDPDERRTSLGTGMIVSADGFILTNYHVVKGASLIRVWLNPDAERPERPVARLVSFDEESDLAVLRVATREGLAKSLHPVEFADSDAVRIGQWAIAVGAPFDQAQTVTVGVISAKARHLDKEGKLSLQDYLQTDASINPGNSGGPLVDLEGKVIGINTAILSPSRFNVGIGFSVPSNTVRQFLPLLMAGKSVARGFLGIQYSSLDAEVAQQFGIAGGMQVGSLAKRGDAFIGPAKDAGVLEGDIITHVNGRAIIHSDDFRRAVAGSAPGAKLTLSILRPENAGEARREVIVTLGDWNTQNAQIGKSEVVHGAPVPPGPTPQHLGLTVEDAAKLKAADRELFGLSADAPGAVIVAVEQGTAADDAELRRGLRVVRARLAGQNWQPINNKNDFALLEKSLPPGARVLLQVRDRQEVLIYKALRLPETVQ